MGLLYSGYAKDRWWWECVVVLRKLSVILIVSFFYSEGLQLQITLGTIVAAYALHHIFMPFDAHLGGRHKLLHVLERNSILVSIVLLWSATVFLVHPNCENLLCYTLVIVTLISNIVFLGYGCATFVKSFLEHTKIVKHITHKLKKMKYIDNPFRNSGISAASVTQKQLEAKAHQNTRVDTAGSNEDELGEVELPVMLLGAEKKKESCARQTFNEYRTDDGTPFYVSLDGAVSTWKLPPGATIASDRQADDAAARYWEYKTDSGEKFWVSEDGSESVWELPAHAEVIVANAAADLQ